MDARVCRRCCHKHWQGNKIERSTGAVRKCERLVLVHCRIELTSEIVGETVEREERWFGKEGTDTVITGAMDDGCISPVDTERNILDESNRSGADCKDREVVQEQNGKENSCHFVDGKTGANLLRLLLLLNALLVGSLRKHCFLER